MDYNFFENNRLLFNSSCISLAEQKDCQALIPTEFEDRKVWFWTGCEGCETDKKDGKINVRTHIIELSGGVLASSSILE